MKKEKDTQVQSLYLQVARSSRDPPHLTPSAYTHSVIRSEEICTVPSIAARSQRRMGVFERALPWSLILTLGAKMPCPGA